MGEVRFPEQLTIEWLQDMYEKGAIAPEDTIREVVRRAQADADNPIWITPPSADALRPYLERLERMDRSAAPLWGVPFAVKDNIDVAGMPTTAACPEFAYVPEAHAEVVRRLVDAGAIPVGKTNLDQFATGLVGTRSPYGETRNALRPEWLSGGSSSGSAVAVARGHAAFSLGTDTAGSGRVPAALNGLVGYKPSVGAWPTKGLVPACASLDCITVFAHSLADALAVDAAARGAHGGDPWSRDIARSDSLPPSRILLPAEPPAFFGPLAQEYAAAWGEAVRRLTSLGLPVETIDTKLFEDAASILYDGPWVAERWASLGEFVDGHPGTAFPVTERVLRSGAAERHTASAAFQAMHKLQRYKAEARKLLRNAVLAMPTVGGTYTREQVRHDPIATNSNLGKYTNHCNLLDLSAVALPAGLADEGMPFGITLFGLSDQEHLVCGAAELWVGRSAAEEPSTLVAVCGLHMRGFPLEAQMRACGAAFVEEADTAPAYRFVKLPTTPAKPGLIRCEEGGASIRLELWRMPLKTFGGFAAAIPAPLGIGKVELADGREVPGFVCEAYAVRGAEDITEAGSWRNVIS
ncbi:allophanate hydrolase [Paenibacillus sp.]|uniref:allophanate hydrolase n=1 Tax=Paenibacillus sp. TaxID=58172 RepID=UPI002D25FE10|nr:allophanate hydrolase [Paenibacillus sp.]HZG85609.1 allophanate hydrolase [Paenibacillus sp.]